MSDADQNARKMLNSELADYRAFDGAIVLRREGNWYPHRNHKHTMVSRKVFLQECGALKGWLRGNNKKINFCAMKQALNTL